MVLEVTRPDRAFPHRRFLDRRAKVPKWCTSLARPAVDVDDGFRVSRHINTSHSRLLGIRVGWSVVSTPKNSFTHEREASRGVDHAITRQSQQRRRKHGGMPRTVQRPALRWSFSHDPECARALLSCVYHPGYNATTVAELSPSVYAERNRPIEKPSVHAHEKDLWQRESTMSLDNMIQTHWNSTNEFHDRICCFLKFLKMQMCQTHKALVINNPNIRITH